jgi:DNA invertase Pin-like site-specific DNA recombinase
MARSSHQAGPGTSRGRNPASRFSAIYTRLSEVGRTAAQQSDLGRWSDRERLADLRRWAKESGRIVRWYRDSRTAVDGLRPEWDRLMKDVEENRVDTIVCWRLDRLGKTCSELVKLFDHLAARDINLISLKDQVDLSTVPGRRIAGVLRSIALYETEVRAQRILAGQRAARDRGVRWGGSQKGRRLKVTLEHEAIVKHLKARKLKIAHIARATGLSRPTVYKILAKQSSTPDGSKRSGKGGQRGKKVR